MSKSQVNIPKFTQADFEAIERERSKRDVAYFIDEYVKIEDRDVEGIVIPFKLWPAQMRALREFIIERLIQIMKANQLGLTWLIISYAAWRLLNIAGYSAKAISETEIKAKEIIRRIDFILRHLPAWMITDKKNDSIVWYETVALTIVFHHPPKNGKPQEDSVIQAFASSPTAGASFTANLFLFDEWALQQFAREIWTYAFPTINRPTGGQVIGISTIERGTLFEEIWIKKNKFKKIFLGWFEDPRRDKKWYDDTVQELGRDETLKHYPSTPEEALAIPGGAFFGEFNSTIHIKPKIQEIPSYYTKYRFLDYGLDMLACYFAYVDTQGYARIYKEVYYPGLVINEAAYKILEASKAELPEMSKWLQLSVKEKQVLALTAKEKFNVTFAPPDLFNKSNHTGRSGADVWYDNGIFLMKSKNDFAAGCLAVSNWLHPITIRDEQTGEEYTTAKLTIDEGEAPNLIHSFLNIQKDKHNSNVYAKEPHDLTHSVDGVRYFATEIVNTPIDKKAEEEKKKAAARLIPYPTMTKTNRLEVTDRQLVF